MHCQKRRSGFTLVEMLVVLSIVVFLAAITAAFMPRVAERHRSARGADLLQGWLLSAKQWAQRDRVVTGVRLQLGRDANGGWVTDLQYVQQPEDFRAPDKPPFSIMQPGAAPNIVTATEIDFFGGRPTDPLLWPVQVDDYLEIQGGGPLHRITKVLPSTSNPAIADKLVLKSELRPFAATRQYRIIRAPRIVAGEQTLQMPDGVAIDLTPFGTGLGQAGRSIPIRSAPVDILFVPGGSVLFQGSPDKIILWVRDIRQDRAQDIDTLVSIHTRTGFIGAYPVNLADAIDPYTFTRDPRASGL